MFILLVDNNRFYVSVLKEMLQRAGFNSIGYAENGIECVLQINKDKGPDVIIIDENQCQVNGVDILKNIRISRPGIRIIILTREESTHNYDINLTPENKSILYIAKDSITSENLPPFLYTIFAENLTSSVTPSGNNAFSSFRKSFTGISNS
jgi:DNA-binding NarL/FixJ family response regulator